MIDFLFTLGLVLSLVFLSFLGYMLYIEVTSESVFATVEIETLKSGNLILPPGYRLHSMVDSPKSTKDVILFCQREDPNELVVCSGGVIGEVIDIPSGYTAITAVALDNESEDIKFFCQNQETGQYSFCLTVKGTVR